MYYNHHRIFIFSLCILFTSCIYGEKISNIIEPANIKEFEQVIKTKKPMVIEFFAQWCSACKKAKPKVIKYAKKNPEIIFILADQACVGSLLGKYSVRAFPTFIFFDITGTEVARMEGLQESFDAKLMMIKSPAPAPTRPTPTTAAPTPAAPAAPKKIEPAPVPESTKPVIQPITDQIIELEKSEQLDQLLKQHQSVILYFSTTWCGPCKTMWPLLQQVLLELPGVVCIKVDGDKFRNLVQKYAVTGYPTFIMLKDTKQDKMSGATGQDFFKRKLTTFFST